MPEWKRASQRTISARASAELATWQCCSAPSRAVKMRAVTERAHVSSRMMQYIQSTLKRLSFLPSADLQEAKVLLDELS